MVDAVAPFTVPSETAAAYVTTSQDPDMVQRLIEYVANFVPNQTGKSFSPHVTIGLANQLGNDGVAAKKLKGWSLTSKPHLSERRLT